MIYKSCTICGKIHPANKPCKRTYKANPQASDREARKARATNAWRRKSLEVREKACYLCEVCKDKGKITTKGLEVHHITKLTQGGELLDNLNLICLCVEHHKQADNGEIDENYLRELARKRENI